jgi:putative ABC transport system substrate-binding protein
MMNRRAFVTGLGVVLAAPLGALAQELRKSPRIGFLAPAAAPQPESPIAFLLEAFRQGLREHGYLEGQTITVEYRWAAGRFERLRQLADELVGLNVDLIVAPSTPAARAAKQATSVVPIVMAPVGDPIEAGLVVSLAHPGGNVTGLSLLSYDLISKRLELLKTVASRINNVGVLLNPANDSAQTYMKHLRTGANQLGLRLVLLEVREAHELERAADLMAMGRVDCLLVIEDPVYLQWPTRIAALAAQRRLPAMYGAREFVAAGGLISYAPSFPEIFRRAASFVDRILKGARPGDLPVEQPTTFEFVINLKTAKALGLTIPPSLLLRADQVIE